MSGVLICLGGAAAVVLAGEVLWRLKILRGEFQRKFVHIVGGTFAAFWPWLVSWRTIQILGFVLLAGVLANRYKKFSHFTGGVRRKSYGDIYSAVAIILCASLTEEPVFYALAVLHLAVADGLAAVVGIHFTKRWGYKVFGQTKTVIGSMTFWTISLVILGAGIPFAGGLISFDTYALMLFLLPPVLTAIENLSVYGSDNVTVPVAVIGALSAAQTF